MRHPLARGYALPVVALALALAAGCVERTMIITTEPAGAIVYDERNIPLSASPADKTFVYYGKYRFTLVKDGFETLVVEEDVQAPWYEYMFIDFISENLLPFTLRDVHRLHYKLQPVQVFPPDLVLQAATPLRAKGQTIGEPLPPGPRDGQPAPASPPGILANPGPSVVPEPARPAAER